MVTLRSRTTSVGFILGVVGTIDPITPGAITVQLPHDGAAMTANEPRHLGGRQAGTCLRSVPLGGGDCGASNAPRMPFVMLNNVCLAHSASAFRRLRGDRQSCLRLDWRSQSSHGDASFATVGPSRTRRTRADEQVGHLRSLLTTRICRSSSPVSVLFATSRLLFRARGAENIQWRRLGFWLTAFAFCGTQHS